LLAALAVMVAQGAMVAQQVAAQAEAAPVIEVIATEKMPAQLGLVLMHSVLVAMAKTTTATVVVLVVAEVATTVVRVAQLVPVTTKVLMLVRLAAVGQMPLSRCQILCMQELLVLQPTLMDLTSVLTPMAEQPPKPVVLDLLFST
jgi:hypothetical protein